MKLARRKFLDLAMGAASLSAASRVARARVYSAPQHFSVRSHRVSADQLTLPIVQSHKFGR
jgi:hypothetical protein